MPETEKEKSLLKIITEAFFMIMVLILFLALFIYPIYIFLIRR